MAGVVAGRTAISAVGQAGSHLTYRGYGIEELAEKATFEEVAHLLLYGELPSRSQLDEFIGRLYRQRSLPKPLTAVLEQLPATAHPMDRIITVRSIIVPRSSLPPLEVSLGDPEHDALHRGEVGGDDRDGDGAVCVRRP